jgi:hypothetical protein
LFGFTVVKFPHEVPNPVISPVPDWRAFSVFAPKEEFADELVIACSAWFPNPQFVPPLLRDLRHLKPTAWFLTALVVVIPPIAFVPIAKRFETFAVFWERARHPIPIQPVPAVADCAELPIAIWYDPTPIIAVPLSAPKETLWDVVEVVCWKFCVPQQVWWGTFVLAFAKIPTEVVFVKGAGGGPIGPVIGRPTGPCGPTVFVQGAGGPCGPKREDCPVAVFVMLNIG